MYACTHVVEPFSDDLRTLVHPAMPQGQLLSVETSGSLTVEIVWLHDRWEVLALPECSAQGAWESSFTRQWTRVFCLAWSAVEL